MFLVACWFSLASKEYSQIQPVLGLCLRVILGALLIAELNQVFEDETMSTGESVFMSVTTSCIFLIVLFVLLKYMTTTLPNFLTESFLLIKDWVMELKNKA